MNYSPASIAGLRIFHAKDVGDTCCALLAFPIALDSDSGVAHVLEHMVCMTQDGNGNSFVNLKRKYPDLSINAITETQYIAFYLHCHERTTLEQALQQLLMSCLSLPLTESLFAQEGWHVRPSGAAGGVVYNEMKAVYYRLDRQLASATSNLLFDGQPAAFEPGGNPENIRSLRLLDVQAFAARYLNANNAILLLECTELPQLSLPPARTSPAIGPRPVSRFRSRHRHQYIPGDVSEAHVYRRYLLRIGAAVCADNLVLSWLLEALLGSFEQVFQHIGRRAQARYHDDLSGIKNYEGQLYVVITFQQPPGGGSLHGALSSLIKQYLPTLIPATEFRLHLLQQMIRLKEKLGGDNNRRASRLFAFLPYVLEGNVRDFAQLDHELNDRVQLAQDDNYIQHCLHSWLEQAEVREIHIAPADLHYGDMAVREARWAKRMSALAPSDAATVDMLKSDDAPSPIVSTPTWPARRRITTNGLLYQHQVFHLSGLSIEQLTMLPLFFHVLGGRVLANLPVFESFLFAQIVTPNSGLFAASVKTRLPEAGRDNEVHCERAIDAALQGMAEGIILDHSAIPVFRRQLQAAGAALLMHHSHAQQNPCAALARAWGPLAQLDWSAPLLTDPVRRHETAAQLSCIATSLRRHRRLVLNFYDGVDADDLLQALAVQIKNQDWQPASTAHLASPPMEHIVVQAAGQESTCLLKYAVDCTQTELYAALYLAAELLNAGHLTNKLRNGLGAYAAVAGIDASLDQFFILLYRCPASDELLDLLEGAHLADQITLATSPEFERARARALAQFGIADSALNELIGTAYRYVEFKDRKLGPVVACLRTLSQPRATALARQFLASQTAVLAAGSMDASWRDRLTARGVQCRFFNLNHDEVAV